MALRWGFKAEANRISLKVRAQMGLTPICPIDPVAVCSHFEIDLIKLSEVDSSCPFLDAESSAFSAVTIPCGVKRVIVHNDAHHANRQRSNISHELAHCFLGHECTPPLTDDGQRSHNSGVEEEAHWLSGVLLISNEAARHIVENGLNHQARGLYGVSPAMLTYRLRMSGANKILERQIHKVRRRISGS